MLNLRLALWSIGTIGLLSLGACKEDGKKRGSAPVSEETKRTEPKDDGLKEDNAIVAKTQAQCNNDGLSWIPAPAPAKCGSKLVDWQCCREQVVARFPRLKSQIEGAFSSLNDYDLYNCSVEGSKEYRIHFKLESGDGSIKYEYRTITSFMSEPDGPVTCSGSSDSGNSNDDKENLDQGLEEGDLGDID